MVGGRSIRCLLFDLGNTLWTRREETAALAERAAYKRAGGILRRTIGPEAFATLDDGVLGALLQHSIDEQMHKEQVQRPGYEPDTVLVTAHALQQIGIGDLGQELDSAIFEALRVRIPDSRVFFVDTLSTLAALKERGYLLGVVTNRHYGGPLFREDITAMGLFDYFNYAAMAISADLGVCKPHPAIFQYALNALNVSPEETAMVGDQIKADIAGAKGLDIFSIWKPAAMRASAEKQASSGMHPDMKIELLSQLLEVF